MTPGPVLLASSSPRRRELLADLVDGFQTCSPGIDESAIPADHPRTYALRTAFAKARAGTRGAVPGTVVIAADTVVTRRLKLYGKPVDAAEARSILRELSGETHDVITAVAVAVAGRGQIHLDAEVTGVTFRHLGDGEIDAYVATGSPMDKAGAYGIQDDGGRFVERLSGDYYNVVGFPCGLVAAMLEEHAGFFGLNVPVPPPHWAALGAT